MQTNTPEKWKEVGRHRGMLANELIRIRTSLYEKVKTFQYLGSLSTNQNSSHEETKCRLRVGN